MIESLNAIRALGFALFFESVMLLRFKVVLFALSLLSCTRPQTPVHLVGVRVESATAKLDIHLPIWQAAGIPGYEVACELERPVVLYQERATVCVVRRGDTVAALNFRVDGCTARCYDALRKAVIAEFGFTESADRDVYVAGSSGVVHLRPATDNAAELVVTDSEYGKFYVNEQLRKGFSDLSNGLRPH